MRKFIFLLTIIISVSAFAEKLHTNGKNNLDKLVGNWGNYTYYIQNKGGKWYLGVSNWGDDTVDWILIKMVLWSLQMSMNEKEIEIFISHMIQNIKSWLKLIQV